MAQCVDISLHLLWKFWYIQNYASFVTFEIKISFFFFLTYSLGFDAIISFREIWSFNYYLLCAFNVYLAAIYLVA